MKIHPLLLTLVLAGVSRTYGAFECSGIITVSSTAGGVLDDNVKVLEGEDCKIEAGVTIDGNIKVKEGASLEIEATSLGCVSVHGNIKCDKCEGLKIVGSDQCPATGLPVSGSIVASDCSGDVVITGVDVDGDIKIQMCNLGELTVTDNMLPDNKDVLVSNSDASTIDISSNNGAKKIRLIDNDFNGMLACTTQPPAPIPDITISIQSLNMASGGFVLPANQFASIEDDDEITVFGPDFTCESAAPCAVTLPGGICYTLLYTILQAPSDYQITVSVDSGSPQVLTPFNVDALNSVEEYSFEFGACTS